MVHGTKFQASFLLVLCIWLCFVMNVSTTDQQGIDLKLRQAESNKMRLTVAAFKTITEALNSIPPQNTRRVILSIAPGVYWEKIVIPKAFPFITFLGDINPPTIIWNDSSSTIGSDGQRLETFNSATVAVSADYFIAMNIKFENYASYFKLEVEPAVALRISGNKAAFYNCTFSGFQDTLYDHKGIHYFNNCYIQGSIDFIFGSGRSLYESCTVISIAKKVTAITAQKRLVSSSDSGFSFKNSIVKGSGQAYLGRPWGEYSRVIFSNTFMDNLVLPKGWEDSMDGRANYSRTVYYGEYKCAGPGSNFLGRAPWVRKLNDEEVQPFNGVHFIEGENWLTSPG